jgi:endogenous inhibitor of DNA gyrase (YacG/DUF329 family)
MTTETATTAKTPRPTIQQRAREAVCPECGGPVTRRSARGPMPTFCCPEHKKVHANRAIVEGRALVAFVKAWRIDRAQGEIAQKSFEQICRIADQFNAQDKEAKRPRADLYAAKLLADGTQFFDRQHQAQARRTAARVAAREAAEAEA